MFAMFNCGSMQNDSPNLNPSLLQFYALPVGTFNRRFLFLSLLG